VTEYFDSAAEELATIKKKSQNEKAGLVLHGFIKQIEKIDAKLVWDVSLCSEFEGFPEDLRTRVHQTVLKWSAAAQPVGSQGPCYETYEEHVRGIESLISDLHTIFHELAERQIKGFGDDPRTPLRILYSRAEEKREALV